VEFVLADGRKPLMRAPLSEVETALAPAGFLRTHRSWVVNPAHMQALTPTGSGDFSLDLGRGVIAPVSRRHRQALARLRSGKA
jgi:DNA-binding LytR/AlgR family response regulator